MIFGSVCSGIEAASVAWKPLGWRPAFFSEIEAFPRAVLAHRFPQVPLHGDFTTIRAGDYEPIDLLVAGTPCQDFSVAGLRAGLDGDRGALTLQFLALARRLRSRWLVWENVPGILSIDGGRAFGAFLGLLGQCGYGFAYRVLDARYFGVPQRRRRVFVVGHLGDWRPAAAVLFERQSLRGHPAPRREAGEGVTPLLEIGARTRGDGARDGDGIGAPGDPMFTLQAGKQHGIPKSLGSSDGGIDREDRHNLAIGTLNANGKAAGSATQQDAEAGMLVAFGGSGHGDFESETFIAHSLRADGFDASEDGTGRGTPLVPVAFSCKDHGADASDISPTLRAMAEVGGNANAGGQIAVAFKRAQVGKPFDRTRYEPGQSGTLSPYDPESVATSASVRRLTPRECERLQGLPDNWTLVPCRGKPAADGPRYKAIGNSMAVPVMRWLGERIAAVNEVVTEARNAG